MDEQENNWGSGSWGSGPHHRHEGMHGPPVVDQKANLWDRDMVFVVMVQAILDHITMAI